MVGSRTLLGMKALGGLGIVALSFFVTLKLLDYNWGHSASIKFDIEVSTGNTAGLFVNTFTKAPTELPITPGVRQVLAFGGITSDVHMLRLDPPKVIGATVTIYDVVIDDDQGVLRRIGPREIAAWGANDLKVVDVTDQFIKYTVISKDPYLMTGNVVQLR